MLMLSAEVPWNAHSAYSRLALSERGCIHQMDTRAVQNNQQIVPNLGERGEYLKWWERKYDIKGEFDQPNSLVYQAKAMVSCLF